MGINEQVYNHYDIVQDILQCVGNHDIPNEFLMSIFIGNLYAYEIEDIS